MSLTDTDKDGDQRGNPALNQRDLVLQRFADSTTAIHPVTDATTTVGYLKSSNGQLLGNDGTNNIGLFGFDSSGNMVVKVARPGFNADTATDSQLIFNSSQNTFKIAMSGTVAFTPANGGGPLYTVSSGRKTGPVVTHNLGVIPGVLAYTQRPTTGFNSGVLTSLPFLESNATTNVLINAFYSVTTTTLSFFMDFGGGWSFNASPDFVIRYYILQETAS